MTEKSGRLPFSRRALVLFTSLIFSVAFSACGLNSEKKQYVLAETLWTEGNYAASVSEFEKVYSRDPKGKLGLQALFRAANTQAFFLNQYPDAVKKFRQYAQVSTDPETVWEAQLEVGEILFMKLENYAAAIQHYQQLLKQKPQDKDAPLFQFRIGKSMFFLRQFNDAIATWQAVIAQFPGSAMAEESAFEIGVAYYTQGEQSPEGRAASASANKAYHQAMDAYKAFLKKFPQSKRAIEARFGIASCLEELDDLDGAYRAYEALKSVYPSPNVITVKLVRIRERKAQRNR